MSVQFWTCCGNLQKKNKDRTICENCIWRLFSTSTKKRANDHREKILRNIGQEVFEKEVIPRLNQENIEFLREFIDDFAIWIE